MQDLVLKKILILLKKIALNEVMRHYFMIVTVFLCSQATDFSLEDRILLFGNSDIKEAFRELDRDDDGEVGTFL